MKLMLIGFMGSGKSTVSKLVAKALGLKVIELDDLILERSGRKSIQEIFDRDGESRFRDIEEAVARSLSEARGVVISCGGGIVGREQNITALKQNRGIVVLLEAAFTTIVGRLGEDSSRPLFQDRAAAEKLYESRNSLYKKYADYTIITDGLTPDAVAQRTMEVLKSKTHVKN